MLFVWIMLLFFIVLCKCFYFHALSLFISFFLFASCTVLLICLFFPIICSHRCCWSFFFYKYFLWKGYELSGEIALKNNHYYYYYLVWIWRDTINLSKTLPIHQLKNALIFMWFFSLRKVYSTRQTPLSAIIESHSIIHHSFADDLQLQMSAPPDIISELLHSMQSCVSDVKAWATANMLKLNDNKT